MSRRRPYLSLLSFGLLHSLSFFAFVPNQLGCNASKTSLVSGKNNGSYLTSWKTDTGGDDEDDHLFLSGVKALITATGHAAVASYGFGLLVFSKRYAGQIHFITMMRASGFDKLEAAFQKLKRNIRDAVLTVIWNSPSILLARRSMQRLQDRIAGAKKIMREARLAKADGIITASEARHLERLRRQEINNCRRDIRRFLRAAASFGEVWQAIDLDEIRDVLRGFCFQLMAVLASGHNEKWLAGLVSRWCLFLNLGSHVLDVNAKLKYPIARTILRTNVLIDEKSADMIETTAETVAFCSVGVLVAKTYNSTALDLNAALVSSTIAFRGIRGFLKTLCWKEEWSVLYRILDGPVGGVVMVGLTVVGFLCRFRHGQVFQITGNFEGVPWYRAPFRFIELTLDRLVHTMDRVL